MYSGWVGGVPGLALRAVDAIDDSQWPFPYGPSGRNAIDSFNANYNAIEIQTTRTQTEVFELRD